MPASDSMECSRKTCRPRPNAMPSPMRWPCFASIHMQRSIHYSKYERTHYRKLQEKYPQVATRDEIDQLFAGPRALDLYEKVRAESEWPTHDLSIKSLARWCGFEWRDTDPSGASSIEWFDQWARGGDPALRQRLLDYNEDDCRATRVVLDAMKGFAVAARPPINPPPRSCGPAPRTPVRPLRWRQPARPGACAC